MLSRSVQRGHLSLRWILVQRFSVSLIVGFYYVKETFFYIILQVYPESMLNFADAFVMIVLAEFLQSHLSTRSSPWDSPVCQAGHSVMGEDVGRCVCLDACVCVCAY